MVACYKPKSLQGLVTPSKIQASKDSKPQNSAHVEEQKGKAVELTIKDRVDDIVRDDIVTEGMIARLKSMLALVGKGVKRSTLSNKFLIRPKRNMELGGGFCKKQNLCMIVMHFNRCVV